MLIEINIALLGAVAIVASLLSAIFQTKFHKRWAAYAVLGFGASGIFSTVVLFDTIQAIIFGTTSTPILFQQLLTYLSLVSFLISTEILVFMAFSRFWKEGKVQRR